MHVPSWFFPLALFLPCPIHVLGPNCAIPPLSCPRITIKDCVYDIVYYIVAKPVNCRYSFTKSFEVRCKAFVTRKDLCQVKVHRAVLSFIPAFNCCLISVGEFIFLYLLCAILLAIPVSISFQFPVFLLSRMCSFRTQQLVPVVAFLQ